MSTKLSVFVSPIAVFSLWIALSISSTPQAWAAPGDLDATFGSTEGGLLADPGIALVDFGSDQDKFGAVLPTADGKFVVVGDTNVTGGIGVARFNANGLLDTTFSGDGRIVQTYPDPDASNPQPLSFLDAALQADGKVVVAGSTWSAQDAAGFSYQRFGLTRLNADGSIDTTFGVNGGVKTGFGAFSEQSQAVAVAIQGDGKIVVVGWTDAGTTNRNFAIARYNSNGTLDTSFDVDGKAITDFGANQNDVASDLRIQADGKIVVVGYATLAAGGARQFAVARYNANGSLDTSFSSDGKATATTGVANDVAIQADGKIVVVGHNNGSAGLTTALDSVVVRYNANGSLDTTFGSGGINITVHPGGGSYANAVALQSDGKILVGGSLAETAQWDFLLSRYNSNGTLDPTLDTAYGDKAGQVSTPVFHRLQNNQSGALDIVVQADGKIVLGGWANTGVTPRGLDSVLIRYLVSDNPPTIVSAPLTTATVGTAYSYQPILAEQVFVTWSLVTAPAGMITNTVGPGLAYVEWASPVAGSYPVEIKVENSSGFSTQPYTLVVGAPATNTGLRSPAANVTNTGGDGNGFQTLAANAHADDGLFAVDTDSGNGTSTSCTSTNKDKHRYYNYGLVIPSGKTIKGIEVRLDAKADSTTGSPKMCVQLSWDGGTTWTTAKTTATLTTGEKTYTLGSATDKWGRTSWTAANVSDASFRVRVINIASNTARDFSLDWAAVRVHY